ncbi:MAG TPA: XRE family transcriptional regulator [Syntrophorhabdaceae bacterium]|nr:XRE family transcriptional regulator [Syntrophorhabdaceae bacterium]HQM82798.1 XRE family transcriptional regulator [Syntrophorhabdaceae bacterium]
MIRMEEQARNICIAIGKRIRGIRNEKRMTLDEMAAKTGFAKSYLSQIETLKREPPISTLAKIAYVLGVDVFFLLTGEARDDEDRDFSLVKVPERRIVHRPFGKYGYVYESISYKKANRLMDAFVVTTGFEFPTEPLTHKGQELIYVLEGRQEFFYDGNIYEVGEGDCYCFESNKPHYSRSIGDKPGKVLLVFASEKSDRLG